MHFGHFNLLEEGFPQEHIKKEDFNPGNKKKYLRRPPDKNNFRVQMKLGDQNIEFLVQYPDTILQAAKRIKLNLPYSCETGKCGTCAARRISGKIWLSNNEVLTNRICRRPRTDMYGSSAIRRSGVGNRLKKITHCLAVFSR
jgi:ring-1,2-phenylacetyl-CoA epoxidase subunit PaaE